MASVKARKTLTDDESTVADASANGSSEHLALAAESHGGNPFFSAAGPTWAYLVWAALWFVLVLGLGLVSFERREL